MATVLDKLKLEWLLFSPRAPNHNRYSCNLLQLVDENISTPVTHCTGNKSDKTARCAVSSFYLGPGHLTPGEKGTCSQRFLVPASQLPNPEVIRIRSFYTYINKLFPHVPKGTLDIEISMLVLKCCVILRFREVQSFSKGIG